MGFFSFCDAKTGESIPNIYSGERVRPVYMLQPDGKPVIEESSYEGYGTFGGINCYEWLAEMNFGDPSLRALAINADCGGYNEDAERIYLCSLHIDRELEPAFRKAVGELEKPVVFFSNYAAPIPELGGRSMNEVAEAGGSGIVQKKIPLKYPLKFSFDPTVKYEDVPASAPCPYQGYFYDG